MKVDILFTNGDIWNWKKNYSFLGKFTLFAPTNEAFNNIPKWAGKILLKDLLRYHVARGLIYSDDISNELLARSLLAKRDIRINVYKVGSIFPCFVLQNLEICCSVVNGPKKWISKVFEMFIICILPAGWSSYHC